MLGCDINNSVFSDKAFQSYSFGRLKKRSLEMFFGSFYLTNERSDEC